MQSWPDASRNLREEGRPRRREAPSASASDARRCAVLAQDVRHLATEVLEQREQPAVRDGGAVQRMRRLEALLVDAIPNAEAPRLEVGRVRGRGDLAVALLGREPGLDVVLLRRGRAEVAG